MVFTQTIFWIKKKDSFEQKEKPKKSISIWSSRSQKCKKKKHRAVTRSYYRGAAGALLVYDISSRDTYNHVSHWLNDARNLANPDIAIILVGNKVDLTENREVTFMEAAKFAQENGILKDNFTSFQHT